MRDKLLFGTIGLLVGIIVMQWTMPSGQAQVVGSPAGNIVALMDGNTIVGADGGLWQFEYNNLSWYKFDQLPVPLAQIRFIDSTHSFVDAGGNYWEHSTQADWVNQGPPPITPVASQQSTWGKVKSNYGGKEGKK